MACSAGRKLPWGRTRIYIYNLLYILKMKKKMEKKKRISHDFSLSVL